jgi:hypothetical protein
VSRVKVIYLVGAARSGTSLLTALLGEIDGVFAAAEMRLLWKGFEERLCGCGERVSACPVWSPAIEAAYGAGAESPEQIIELQRVTRSRRLPRLLAAGMDDGSGQYLKVMTEMYRALAGSSGCSVLVDSSKSSGEAALLLRAPGIEAIVVHVVRDPRAVAFSWDRVGRTKQQQRKSAPEAAAAWSASNLAAELVVGRYPSSRRLRIRYEDYVHDPATALSAVAAAAGIENPNLDFLTRPGDRSARHMVGGNRLRFDKERITLKHDTEWLSGMGRAPAAVVTGATLPLMLRYGYPVAAGEGS